MNSEPSPKPLLSPKPTTIPKPSISPKPVISKKPVLDRSQTLMMNKKGPRSVLRSQSVSSPVRPKVHVRSRNDKEDAGGGKENVSDTIDQQRDNFEKSLKRRAPPPPPRRI